MSKDLMDAGDETFPQTRKGLHHLLMSDASTRIWNPLEILPMS